MQFTSLCPRISNRDPLALFQLFLSNLLTLVLSQPEGRYRGVPGRAEGAVGDVAGAAGRVDGGAAPDAPPVLESIYSREDRGIMIGTS